MADDMDKIGQAGQGTIDIVKPAKQQSVGAKQAESTEKQGPLSCDPSGCSEEEFKEQQKSKAG